MIVYKITNKITNDCYIGITTKSIQDRWYGHIRCYKRGVNRHLYLAMHKYGLNNFMIEMLDTASSYKELLDKESYYIRYYDSYNKGYNMTLGGEINPMQSKISEDKHNSIMRSQEVRNKISGSMKQYRASHPFTEEHRNNISKAMQGNHNATHPDNRSVEVYCVHETAGRHKFKSIKDAGIWWYTNFKPFGESYSEATYQRKIKKSIANEDITYICPYARSKKIVITDIHWYRGGDANEEVNKDQS